MGVKEFLESLSRKKRERKRLLESMDEQLQIERTLEERQKSSNQRELERFLKEEREEEIKKELDFYRKKRENDINFGHNPLNIPNITAHTDWEVMKEKNMFKGRGNMFSGQEFIHKNNPKLLNSGNILKNNKKLFGI